MKKILSILLVITMMISLAACGAQKTTKAGDSDLAYVKANGKIIIGYTDYAPMNYYDENGNFTGFDTELAIIVCEKLGLKPEFVEINWDTKEVELNAKSIDCIWNGLSLTPKNQENMTTTKPYMTNNITLVVKSDSPISKFEDMAGKSLAVQSGSAAEETLDADENKVFKASLKEVNGFDEYITAMLDMESGNSDAVLMDSVVANYMIKDLGKNYKVLEGTLLEDNYVVGFRKGDEALRDAVWNALKELKQEGRIAEISSKWFGFDITTID